MKIAILSNQAFSMVNFWRTLIKLLIRQGNEIYCLVPQGDEASQKDLRDLGAEVVFYPLDRKGINPLRDMVTFWRLKKIFCQLKIDLLFATTIKPVIYGCLAAWLARVPCIYATITGLGYAFERDTLAKNIIHWISRFLYSLSLSHATGIFFQNRDDIQLFQEQKILKPDARVFIARGTGVDTDKFSVAPFPDEKNIIFLLVARLLEAKGLQDYAKAAAMLLKKHPHAKFRLLGGMEEGRGAIDSATLAAWQKDGIEYLGATRDVRPYIQDSHVAVLPSWREGTPTSIMEAMSMGRPCVVSDVPGCREVVSDGVNGFLCRVRDPDSLAQAMEKFILDPASISVMGKKSRQMAEDLFDADKVALFIWNTMDQTCREWVNQ